MVRLPCAVPDPCLLLVLPLSSDNEQAADLNRLSYLHRSEYDTTIVLEIRVGRPSVVAPYLTDYPLLSSNAYRFSGNKANQNS
jgi:hypothetical protein